MVPVSVEYDGGMPTEQRDLVGELAALVQRYDCKGAATRGIPIDGKVLGVDLRNISATSIAIVCERSRRTLTRLVSQALRLMRRLS